MSGSVEFTAEEDDARWEGGWEGLITFPFPFSSIHFASVFPFLILFMSIASSRECGFIFDKEIPA